MSETAVTPRVARPWDVVVAFVRIGWLEAVSYPVAFLQQRLTLFGALAVFAVLSSLISEDTGAYLGFVVVGLACAEVLDAGTAGLSQRLSVEINTGRLETYLTEPVSPSFLPFGIVLFELMARVLTAVIVVGISIPLGARYVFGLDMIGALALTLLGAAAVLGVAIAGSSIRLLTKRSDPILVVYSLAARFLGGVFFPVEQLPDIIQPLSWLVPHTYVTSAVRGLVMADPALETPTAPSLATVVLLAMVVVTLPLGIWLFRRAVETGRRLGILSGY